MKNYYSLFLGSLISVCTLIPAPDLHAETNAVSLSSLAAKSDLVAVAHVRDTEYTYTRSFPSEGSAFLRLLITYKSDRTAEDIIKVYEKGLHPHECYFESPDVFGEGRRYLVFFRRDHDDPDIYRGLEEGCALEILVTDDNRYALKYPVEGIELTDDLEKLASRFEFRDNNAVVSDESLAPELRNDLLERGLIVPYQGDYKYTHGVDLTTARKLISAEALEP